MKNKFLLLGATALLSTGALMANAANPTDDMNVNVELIMVSQFKVDDNLDFGRWVIPNGTKSITFSMNDIGEITTTTQGATKIGSTNSGYGSTHGAPCNTLTFPSTVYLTTVDSAEDPVSAEYSYGTLTGIHAVDDDYTNFDCIVYADNLTITGKSEGDVLSSQYSGKFTITAVLDPTTTQNP